MGLYHNRKMAIYYWSRILGILFCSLIIFIISIQLSKSSEKKVQQMVPAALTPQLSMEDWLELSQEFHLHLLRFRPRPMGGFDIWIQGKYQNILFVLKNLQENYPEIIWYKILLEQKNNVLMMHLEAGR
jgi:hypothetical protein